MLDCVYKLRVFMGKSLHVSARVFNCFFFSLSACMCVRVCVREGEAETVTGTQMHPDCDTASHSHDLQFLLDYQQMEIRGEICCRASDR